MSLASLAARFIQERLATLSQEAHQHLLDFVTMAENQVHAAEVNTEAAISHLVSLGHAVLHPDGTASGVAPSPNLPPATLETKVYTDGTTVTGTVPLPDQSPAQQDAAAAGLQPDRTPGVAPPPADAGTPEQATDTAAPAAGQAESAAPSA